MINQQDLDCTLFNGTYHVYHQVKKLSFFCDKDGNKVDCPTGRSLWDSVEPIPEVIYRSALQQWNLIRN